MMVLSYMMAGVLTLSALINFKDLVFRDQTLESRLVDCIGAFFAACAAVCMFWLLQR